MKEYTRDNLRNEIELRLGGILADVELDREHYDLGMDLAFRRYRQRSSNSLQENFVFLEVQKDVQTYTLPDEIQEVRSIYRRSLGSSAGGVGIDPFSAAFANNIYMVQNPGNISTGGTGALATYDFAMQFQKLAGKMFGRDVQFTWNASTKKLLLHRQFTGKEEIALHTYMQQPDNVLLKDPYALPWLQDYALAQCKLMLAAGRGKFSSLAGPQGGITLNAAELKSDADAEILRLDEELKHGVDASEGYGFIIG